MRREIHKWLSPNLNKEMDLVVYGDFGDALLMFPTAGADYLEYERFHLIESITPYIESGKIKVFSINSINNESWLNDEMAPQHKATRHQQFNEYVYNEVIPFIKNDCNGDVNIYTTGASLGALHCANIFFKRPDLIAGIIAMSGAYSLRSYSKGYFDDNCYFNSPVDYLANLTDEDLLEQMRDNKKIIIASGQGNYEDPDASKKLSSILDAKQIPHTLDLWGYDMPHDWPTWRKMLPYFIETKL